MNLNVDEIKKQAEKELFDEQYRDAVDKCKAKLKERKTLWDRIFPYKILIVKKEK